MEIRGTLVAAIITVIPIVIATVAGLCGKSSVWFFGTLLTEIIIIFYVLESKARKGAES